MRRHNRERRSLPVSEQTGFVAPFMLFLQVTSLNSYARRDFVIRAYVRPWTDMFAFISLRRIADKN